MPRVAELPGVGGPRTGRVRNRPSTAGLKPCRVMPVGRCLLRPTPPDPPPPRLPALSAELGDTYPDKVTRVEKGASRRRWTDTAKTAVVALSFALAGTVAFALLLLLATPGTGIRYAMFVELTLTAVAAVIGGVAAREWWIERSGLRPIDHIRVRLENRRTRP